MNPTTKTDIATNARQFDLIRYMRSELLQAKLITMAEYGWLCGEAPLAKGSGSPSPRRLEDYDKIRAREAALLAEVERLRALADNMGCRLQDSIYTLDCAPKGNWTPNYVENTRPRCYQALRDYQIHRKGTLRAEDGKGEG